MSDLTDSTPEETTDLFRDADPGTDGPARIYPLVADPGNETMLVEWLESVDEYEVVQPASIADASFDLCIVDQGALVEHHETLKDRKQSEEPVLLPYLLLLPDGDADIFGTEHSQLPDTLVKTTVDEMLTLPVRQLELRWRIESLLRMRGQTQTLANREQKLRRFKRATTAAGHAIYITDTDGVITYVNAAFERTTGYSQTEAIGETPELLDSDEMSEGYFQNLWETVRAGDVWEEEIVNERKNGDLYHASQTIAPIPDADGEIEGFVAIQTDISERKDIEEKRQQYQQAVDSSAELFAAIDTDDNYLFSNDAYRTYHGIDADDIRGRGVRDVLDSETIDAVESKLAAARDGETVQFETTRPHPEKGERVLDVLYYPLCEDGVVQGVIGSMRDVTEEKEGSRRLRTLIENLPGIVYRCRNEAGWPMAFVGGPCEAITGYRAAELESGDVSWGDDVIHPEDREDVDGVVTRAVAAGEAFEHTYRIQTAAGETRWVHEQGREIDSLTTDESMLEGFITDVTERKERERELRQKTRAIDEAPIGLVITDPKQTDNPLVSVNDAFVDMTGYARSEALGRNCRFLQGEHTDPETVARIRRGIDAEKPVSVTLRNYREDGSEFWNQLDIAPVRDSDGEVINFVGFQQNVTELVDRQQQLQVIDRVLRHNLHNDLNVVQGMADQIQTESGDQLSGYAQRIIDTSDSLLETMDKEREITKLLGDEPIPEDVDLRSIVQSAVDSVQADYPEATIESSVPEPTVVRATVEVQTAITELLSNALEHDDQEPPQARVTVSNTHGETTLRIIDSNPEIPEMERDILLGKKEETPLYHGRGLGLWLVQLIVRRSNATIEWTANEPRGNVVEITLQDAETA